MSRPFFRLPSRRTVPHTVPVALATAGLVGAGLFAYALFVEPYLLELTHPEIFLPRLPRAWDGVSVLLLADPHVITYGRREEKLLQLLGEMEKPDVIVWAGDFLQGGANAAPSLRLVNHVQALFPQIPAFAVLGNAEHKMNAAKRRAYVRELSRAGLHVLNNEHTALTLRGETITVAGVDDPYYGHADINAALRHAPPPRERFTLLLSHSPQTAVLAARQDIDLMLSGHTHGGQVRLPLLGPLKTQNPLSRKMDCGLWNRARLSAVLKRDAGGDLITYISRGIGVANVPKIAWLTPRFLCRPEVARLVLRCAEELTTP